MKDVLAPYGGRAAVMNGSFGEAARSQIGHPEKVPAQQLGHEGGLTDRRADRLAQAHTGTAAPAA